MALSNKVYLVASRIKKLSDLTILFREKSSVTRVRYSSSWSSMRILTGSKALTSTKLSVVLGGEATPSSCDWLAPPASNASLSSRL